MAHTVGRLPCCVRRASDIRPVTQVQTVPLTVRTARSSSRVHGWGDELLDFIEAGPKMRKWYGEGQVDDIEIEFEEVEPEVQPAKASDRDAVVVMDAETPTGEQIVLQLILARAQVKALVRDAPAFSNAFGSYATPVQAGSDDTAALQRAMADAKAVICPGKLGQILPAAMAQKVPHIVLLTSAERGALKAGFFGALLKGQEQATLADPAREAAVMQSGIPCSIVGVGSVDTAPGQLSSLDFRQVDGSPGSIAREDLAAVLAQASLHKPPAQGVRFQVAAVGQGSLPSNWQQVFQDLHSRPDNRLDAAAAGRT